MSTLEKLIILLIGICILIISKNMLIYHSSGWEIIGWITGIVLGFGTLLYALTRLANS